MMDCTTTEHLKVIGEMAQGLYPVNSIIHKISYGFSFDSDDSPAECAWGLSSSVKELREFARFPLLDSELIEFFLSFIVAFYGAIGSRIFCFDLI